MSMPRPTEHHLRLQRIIGDWTGEETIYPSPWDPAGGKACARIVNRGSLDGFAVIQDYEQERNGNINFRGHAIFTWNTHEQCYVMYWFDSMGLPPLVLKGTFIDHILTLSNENPGGMSQAMFDFSKDNEYRYRMDVSQDGARWHTFMEGIYTK